MELIAKGCFPRYTIVTKKPNDTQRKPTHTDRYLHANCHHHLGQKNSIISLLIGQALKICKGEHLDQELNHVQNALMHDASSRKDVATAISKLQESG